MGPKIWIVNVNEWSEGVHNVKGLAQAQALHSDCEPLFPGPDTSLLGEGPSLPFLKALAFALEISPGYFFFDY